MDILSMNECVQVAGGDGEPATGGGGSGGSPSPIEETIGEGLGKALHSLLSREAAIGGLLSPAGAVIGAVIHHNNNH